MIETIFGFLGIVTTLIAITVILNQGVYYIMKEEKPLPAFMWSAIPIFIVAIYWTLYILIFTSII